jgi:hypothetical protein
MEFQMRRKHAFAVHTTQLGAVLRKLERRLFVNGQASSSPKEKFRQQSCS